MPMNFAKTAGLLAALTAIFLALGGFVGGEGGLAVAFAAALVMNGVAYWKSDSIVLRMQNAQEVTAETGGQLYATVQALANRAGLPMPRVYLMDVAQPNAFATGRDPAHAAVCASTGLVRLLTPEELAGVLAHELAHIRNRDTLTMMVAATLGSAISLVAQWLQVSLFLGNRGTNRHGRLATFAAILIAPFAAMLVQLAVSRSREYQADRLGAIIIGNPLWLASALEKIQIAVRGLPNPAAEQVPAMAHLFIINPLTGRGLDSLFLTHPSTENRILELRKLAVEMGLIGEGSARPGLAPGGTPVSRDHNRPRGIWG